MLVSEQSRASGFIMWHCYVRKVEIVSPLIGACNFSQNYVPLRLLLFTIYFLLSVIYATVVTRFVLSLDVHHPVVSFSEGRRQCNLQEAQQRVREDNRLLFNWLDDVHVQDEHEWWESELEDMFYFDLMLDTPDVLTGMVSISLSFLSIFC